MLKKLLFTTLLFVVICSCLTAKGVDPLWTKAQEFYNNNWNLVPGLMKMTTSMTGPQSVTAEFHVGVKQTDEGLESEFIKGVMGEEEITADNPVVNQILAQDFTPKKDGVFVDDPNEIKLKRKGNQDFEGIDCAVFSYKKTVTDESGKETQLFGTVFLDAKTGEPIKDENSMLPLPQFVTAMKNTSYYKTNSKGKFFASKVISETVIEAGGQKMENTTTMKMSKHFEYTPPSEEDLFEE